MRRSMIFLILTCKRCTPQAEEGLIKFLEHCKLNYSKTMMCLGCNAIFNEEAAKKLEGTRMYDPRRGR